jgi:negative regulator of replication initiation
MELEECIKDALEETMKTYIASDEYVSNRQKVNRLLVALREQLSAEQNADLNHVIDAITVSDGAFASEAYLRGVVEGISLKDRVAPEN